MHKSAVDLIQSTFDPTRVTDLLKDSEHDTEQAFLAIAREDVLQACA